MTGLKNADELQKRVGENFAKLRKEEFKLSQPKYANEITHLEGDNLYLRIGNLEKGNGSAKTIFAVMNYLYEKGVNLNFLFGDNTKMRVVNDTSIYSENVTDYLRDVKISGMRARNLLTSILEATNDLDNHIERTLAIAAEIQEEE